MQGEEFTHPPPPFSLFVSLSSSSTALMWLAQKTSALQAALISFSFPNIK